MRITADTNVLLRACVADDPVQAQKAVEALENAERVVISLQSFCELAWVLGRHYQTARSDIAATIRALLDTHNVVTDRSAVESGLAVLEAGGDFADGIIAHEGRQLGGEVFLSFDKKAVKYFLSQGFSAKLL
ncbi:MAG: type II toxin-antitoxin system VapC family toxin [Zoogloeaceae bacterium]|jgi:predicted nucleic-acid-binding protein|nr:type II toxin-antitoxin system VapC family toxin [Zoogloeaceae bacterium]